MGGDLRNTRAGSAYAIAKIFCRHIIILRSILSVGFVISQKIRNKRSNDCKGECDYRKTIAFWNRIIDITTVSTNDTITPSAKNGTIEARPPAADKRFLASFRYQII